MKSPEQRGQGRPYHGAVKYTTRLVRAGIALAIMGVVGWLGGCSDGSGPVCCDPPQRLIVSDPVLAASPAAGVAPASALASAGDEVAYVSLPPGTVPTGSTATVRRVGDAPTLITSVLDGGFDPVSVGADVGDSIEVLVTDADNRPVAVFGVAVRAARPPIVVRTNPPRRKTDVPLNSAIVVVFSEPVAGASTTPASIRLLSGSTTVSGTVRFLDPSLDASHLRAEFVPDAPLAPLTPYRLVVTRDVRDLSGDPLAAADTADFTTGQSSTGPPASILISTDSILFVPVGESYRLTAVVRDSSGNELTGQPVAWASDDINVVTVSPTGLVTALADGFVPITASVGAVSKRVYVEVRPNPAASITIAPDPATVAATDTIVLAATARDAAGRLINVPYPPLEWTTSAPGVATVTVCCGVFSQSVAKVTGVNTGTATINATSGTAHGSAVVTVTPARPVASVTIVPDSTTLVVSGSAKLFAILRDANNQLISGRTVTWKIDATGVATVDTSGLTKGVSLGSTRVSATSEGIVDTAAITVTTISLTSVSAGGSQYYWGSQSCGLTARGAAYCWGANQTGELGLGTLRGPEDCGGYPCSTVPAVVTGGLTFTSLSAGENHTCAVTIGGNAYCWGDNSLGGLGIGAAPDVCNTTIPCSVAPVAVSGGLTFTAVTAGGMHSCGVTTDGAAYCWGQNGGQLGTQTQYNYSDVPVPVSGGLTFATLAAGSQFTCGLTTDGTVYCWGELYFNGNGWSGVPEAVSGGLTFVSLTSGHRHACGLTAGGIAYCWGSDAYGELGDGTFSNSPVPVPVSGGLTFSSLSAGVEYTCGLTPGGAAYCWGWNSSGQLGTGSTTDSRIPVAVTGGLTFTSVSAGGGLSGGQSCGLTTTGAVYCWGYNLEGQLGNRTTTNSNVPVKVAGQQ